MKKIIVVGGGPAGMMAAIRAAEGGAQVTLFEKMDSVGRKLAITGKGRCNLTNAAEFAEVIKNIPGNGKFLFSALKNFSTADTVNFFESLGVKTKVERGNRVFPESDDAKEVIDALTKKMALVGVEVKTNSPVTEILAEDKKIVGVRVNGETVQADAVILATGGASYPATGSTGDGFEFARQLGHKVTDIFPALVPLEVEEEYVADLQGLALKNVLVKLLAGGRVVTEIFGEMLFTHFGVSGPIILTLSRQAVQLLTAKKFVELEINLKPAMDYEELDDRLLRDFDKYRRKAIKNALVDLLPAKLIPVVLDAAYLNESKRVDEITNPERRRLIETLQGLILTVTKPRPIDEAIITAGGVNVKEIDPKTMRSKLVENLYIVGEVVDVDGLTGGFNLQAAWSMGNTAGINAAAQ